MNSKSLVETLPTYKEHNGTGTSQVTTMKHKLFIYKMIEVSYYSL